MKNICHNFYRKIIFNASALVRGMKIADPALTSGWETQLAGMEQGKLTQEEFLEGALKLAGEVTEEIFRKYQK